jgi:ComF family protein
MKRFIDTLFPPKCMVCNTLIEQIGGVCPACWHKIDFTTLPCCNICGDPFEYEIGPEALCGMCIHTPPLYSKAYSVFRYNEGSKEIIHKFKYSDATYMAPYLARWMLRSGADAIEECDLIIPVPLHPYKLLRRLYNQSYLLASYLSKYSNKPVVPKVLQRIKNNLPQIGLPRAERLKNVTGAFKLNPKYQHMIDNKHIVLVDDVMTTGATINACTKPLLAAGCKSVRVITLAKTKIS